MDNRQRAFAMFEEGKCEATVQEALGHKTGMWVAKWRQQWVQLKAAGIKVPTQEAVEPLARTETPKVAPVAPAVVAPLAAPSQAPVVRPEVAPGPATPVARRLPPPSREWGPVPPGDYEGKVTRIETYGVFLDIRDAEDNIVGRGLVHHSLWFPPGEEPLGPYAVSQYGINLSDSVRVRVQNGGTPYRLELARVWDKQAGAPANGAERRQDSQPVRRPPVDPADCHILQLQGMHSRRSIVHALAMAMAVAVASDPKIQFEVHFEIRRASS